MSTDLRDLLKLGPSEKPPEGGESVPELAEKIKGLKAANTVEAAPERTVRRAARAERPVTAMIRERKAAESVTMEEPVEATPGPAALVEAPKLIAIPEPVKPVGIYRQKVVVGREGDGRQSTLFRDPFTRPVPPSYGTSA